MIRNNVAPSKAIHPPEYFEDLFKSALDILDSGYLHEKQQKSPFFNFTEGFSLQSWDRLHFVVPPIIEKQQIYTGSGKPTQEVRLKFVYHEPNDLGFASLIVLSLEMSRGLAAELTTSCPPEDVLHGAKWKLQELKYLLSPHNKKLICLSW